jgi:hypothetical protein
MAAAVAILFLHTPGPRYGFCTAICPTGHLSCVSCGPMGSSASQGCPHCACTNIIRTGTHRTCDSWYCYECKRSFEMKIGSTVRVERRNGADRRKQNGHSLTLKH